MKKNIALILIIFILFIISCNIQKSEESAMIEKYNFELINKSHNNPLGMYQNGWTIVMYKMTESGAYYNEYPPAPHFYKIQKEFYPNGMLKSKKELPFGEEIYYDEKGNIIEKVDLQSKLGKIKYNWILEFLDKEGYIDLETGEGREHALIGEDGQAYIISSRFNLSLTEGEKQFWVISIPPAPWNKSHETIYHLDKDTGEVLFKESTEKFPVM